MIYRMPRDVQLFGRVVYDLLNFALNVGNLVGNRSVHGVLKQLVHHFIKIFDHFAAIFFQNGQHYRKRRPLTRPGFVGDSIS